MTNLRGDYVMREDVGIPGISAAATTLMQRKPSYFGPQGCAAAAKQRVTERLRAFFERLESRE